MSASILDFLSKSGDDPGAEAFSRLAKAYRTLFEGRGGSEDAGLVFEDLLRASGFYGTTASDATDRDLWKREGMRELMSRIIRFTTMSEREFNQRVALALEADIADVIASGDSLV